MLAHPAGSSDGHFRFGNNLASQLARPYSGDNLWRGRDDEQIKVNLTRSHGRAEISCWFHLRSGRRDELGQVTNAFIRIVDTRTGSELTRWPNENASTETAMIFSDSTGTAGMEVPGVQPEVRPDARIAGSASTSAEDASSFDRTQCTSPMRWRMKLYC
jgi:hypothetical protein